jgi:hypothetical protein
MRKEERKRGEEKEERREERGERGEEKEEKEREKMDKREIRNGAGQLGGGVGHDKDATQHHSREHALGTMIAFLKLGLGRHRGVRVQISA